MKDIGQTSTKRTERKKGRKGQILEPKIGEETIEKTPREKRMQHRIEKEEKVQLKSVIAKETTQKQKEKTQSTKQAETGTWISTGSGEKEQ